MTSPNASRTGRTRSVTRRLLPAFLAAILSSTALVATTSLPSSAATLATAVTVPSSGGSLSGTGAPLDAAASTSNGVGIAKVQFVLSGGSYSKSVIGTATPTLYGYVAVWNTTSVPNGTYTLQSLATDTAGNTAYSSSITVIVNNPPPTTAVIAPSNGAALSGTGASLDAAASASNGVGIAKVQFVLSGGSYSKSVIGTATPTLYGFVYAWNTTSVPNGTYTLQSLATDAAGKTAYSAGITITVSNTASNTAPPTFDDEFQGSTLSSAWTAPADPGDASNQEQECFSPNNVTVTGGMLEEKAQVGSISNCDCPPAPASTKPCGYISGAVQWTSLSFKYGTVTVRAKLAGGQGTWPAIWLLGTDCQSPNWLLNNCAWPEPGSNEIDIAEILQSKHTQVNEQIHTENSSGAFESPGCTASTSDVSQNWHTYTLIWAPGSLTWEIDGVQTCKTTSYVPSTPMFMIINLAVGGAGGGTVQNSTLPQTTEIDYVKVT
jgi:beta-glucanase (GH16 family)